MILWGAIGGSAIISGAVLSIITILLNHKDKKDANRAQAAQEESVIIMRSIQGIGHLAEATATGLKENHFDGNIDEALNYYHKSRDDMNNFLLRQNAEANH